MNFSPYRSWTVSLSFPASRWWMDTAAQIGSLEISNPAQRRRFNIVSSKIPAITSMVLSQIGQNLPGVLGCIVEWHQLEFNSWTLLLQFWPQIHQNLSWCHGWCTDTDDVFALFHDIFCPGHRIFAILDNVFCVLCQRFTSLRQLKATMGAHKKLQIQIFLQQIDLFDDCRGEINNFSAALLKLPHSATHRKVSNWGLYMGNITPSFSVFS